MNKIEMLLKGIESTGASLGDKSGDLTEVAEYVCLVVRQGMAILFGFRRKALLATCD